MAFLREKSGRWSPEKILAFAIVILPLFWLIGRAVMGDLGARPVTEAIHFTGRWAVRFLLLSLLITPARRLFAPGKLILTRRTIGVAAAGYAAFHFVLYVVDQKYDLAKVATEIVLRFYLTIGFVALIGLLALGITSTDAMIRRLGQRWTTLHKATYVLAALAIVHFTLQKKLEIYQPVLMAGFLFWLLGYRLLIRFDRGAAWPAFLGLAVASAVLTALFEAGWYAVKTGVPAGQILEINLTPYVDWDSWTVDLTPAWWVLAAGLAVTLGHLAFRWWKPAPAPRQRAPRPAQAPRAARSAPEAALGSVQGQSGN